MLAYGYNCYAVDSNISYIGTATQGTVRAEAKCKDSHESDTGQVRVRIYDEKDNMIAKCVFTVAYTGEKFDVL